MAAMRAPLRSTRHCALAHFVAEIMARAPCLQPDAVAASHCSRSMQNVPLLEWRLSFK
jgi:hypothetical protein